MSERLPLVVMVELDSGGMTYRPQEKTEPYLVRLRRAQESKCSAMTKSGDPCKGKPMKNGLCLTHCRVEL